MRISRQKVVVACLVLTGLGGFWLASHVRAPLDAGIGDPAYEFYTQHHSRDYGGMDRWAYGGMPATRVEELLRHEGYKCQFLSESSELRCSRRVFFPLSRTLTVIAKTEASGLKRLLSAHASSELTGWAKDSAGYLAAPLRSLGLLEPERLQISGFRLDSLDSFARLVVDALQPKGWWRMCTDESAMQTECSAMAKTRRANGLPELPQGPVQVDRSLLLYTLMGHIHLSPLVAQDASTKARDELLVRISDNEMWIDFAGYDLLGRSVLASVRLGRKGGAADRMLLTLGQDKQEFELVGIPEGNIEAARYLLPLNGDTKLRATAWLDLPVQENAATYARIASVLRQAAPDFVAPMLSIITNNLDNKQDPEERIGLYPTLRSIESRANVLRAAQASSWLPPAQSFTLIHDAFPDDLTMRSAWALALCEERSADGIDAACWRRFVLTDQALVAYFQRALAEQQSTYNLLPPQHPIQQRLRRLNELLTLSHGQYD